MQLYYAGASRYIGLFGSRDEACTAYNVARECMLSFKGLDPSPEQIMRNLDKLRKAAISKGGIGADHVERSNPFAELNRREIKPNDEITKLKSKGESSSSIDRRQQVVATLTSGRSRSDPLAALHVDSRNRPEFVSSNKAERSKYEADSAEESSATMNGTRSPSRSKTIFTKEGPMKVEEDSGAGAKSAKNGSRSPVRSRPLLIVQPKEKTEENGRSFRGEVLNESLMDSRKRTSMSSIYHKAMSMELPRGITVRPSGKWVSIVSNCLDVVFMYRNRRLTSFYLFHIRSKSNYTMEARVVTWVSSNPSSMLLWRMSWQENAAVPSR